MHFRAITDDANRGNVTFYPVYARGLASFDAPIGPDYPPPIQQDMPNLRTRHDHMRTLAVETDGEAIIDTNYIEKGLKRIADDLSSYYLFGYYSTNTKTGRTVQVDYGAGQTAGRPCPRATWIPRAHGRAGGRRRSGVYRPGQARCPERAELGRWRERSIDIPGPACGLDAFAGRRGWRNRVGGRRARISGRCASRPGPRERSAEVLLLAADSSQLAATQVDVPAGQGAFGIRLATSAPLAPGDYAVRVRLRGRDTQASDTARVTIPEQPSAVGEAVMWRRGPSTGPQYVRTADPRYQRSDRLRLELATDAGAATARLLDRVGKVLQVPVQVSERADAADGIRWIVADVSLAPLAPGDYAIEVSAGDATQVTGFRIIP